MSEDVLFIPLPFPPSLPLSHRVDLKSGVNKMTAHNLSVVFAPTLMRSPSEDMSLVNDIPLQRHFLEILILKHSDLFD